MSEVKLPRRVIKSARSQTNASSYDKGKTIPNQQSRMDFSPARSLRDLGQVAKAIRKLVKLDGTVSSAVFSYVQVANSGFSVRAYDSSTHEFSPEGTKLAR